ncbi:MAG TPA: hypothetical protein VMH88_14070 [Gemmatimonadales bacterium]|nr:hypothetical protein [Gemmatimonadales bacterium]
MTSSASKPSGLLGELLHRRLRELGRSTEDLAEAVAVPTQYIDDLIKGSRRPPRPARTDIYQKMTTFLRLGRNEIVACADAERASAVPAAQSGPDADVRSRLLALCAPETARKLERRRARGGPGGADLTGYIERLLDVAQGAVRRMLDDQIGLRALATARGSSYEVMRLRVLDFLDTTVDGLTTEDLAEFLLPRIASWDVDLATGVFRVVLRTQEVRERSSRREATDGVL